MKELVALCLLLTAACAATIQSDSFRDIIEKINSLNTTWKADPNFPPDITISSIKRLLGAWESDSKLPEFDANDDSNGPIPESFDARRKWTRCPSIRQIPSQSNCGSCWAVASASAFSDRLCIASNSKFKSALSARHLLSCCRSCGSGCGGGYTIRAWKYFKDVGIVSGGPYNSSIGCQPYPFPRCGGKGMPLPLCSSLPKYRTPKCQKRCTNPAYATPFSQDRHKIKKVYSLRNVKVIQKNIMNYGPVVADFRVYADFPTYKAGVYQHKVGKYLFGHSVRIIGWGTDKGTPYWLAVNSWDIFWGDGGLFKIRRGYNECGIESSVVAGIPDV